jgi:cathepsin D
MLKIFTRLETLGIDRSCKNVEELPTITFVIDDIHYILLPSDYLVKIEDESECFGSFMGMDIDNEYGPSWILGDAFLSKYYSVFDRDFDKVGFAEAV